MGFREGSIRSILSTVFNFYMDITLWRYCEGNKVILRVILKWAEKLPTFQSPVNFSLPYSTTSDWSELAVGNKNWKNFLLYMPLGREKI